MTARHVDDAALTAFGHGWRGAWPHSDYAVHGDLVFWDQPRCRLDAFGHRVVLRGAPTRDNLRAAFDGWCDRHRAHQVASCVVSWHLDHDQPLSLPPRGWRLKPLMALQLDALPDPAPVRLRVLPMRGDESSTHDLDAVAAAARGLSRGPAADLVRWRWRAQNHQDAYYVVSAPYYRVSAAAVVGSDGREGMLVDAFCMPGDRRRQLATHAVAQVLHDYLRTTDGLVWCLADPGHVSYPRLLRSGFVPSHHVLCLVRDAPWAGPYPLPGVH